MSKTIRKYQVRDKSKRYERIEKIETEGRYYTDVAKSHDRKIRKKGLENGHLEDEADYPEE
jgi:hypothetical protein